MTLGRRPWGLVLAVVVVFITRRDIPELQTHAHQICTLQVLQTPYPISSKSERRRTYNLRG